MNIYLVNHNEKMHANLHNIKWYNFFCRWTHVRQRGARDESEADSPDRCQGRQTAEQASAPRQQGQAAARPKKVTRKEEIHRGRSSGINRCVLLTDNTNLQLKNLTSEYISVIHEIDHFNYVIKKIIKFNP